LPAIWSAETTTNQERKKLLRMAIESVQLDGISRTGQVEVQIRWSSGAITSLNVNRARAKPEEGSLKTPAEAVSRIHEMAPTPEVLIGLTSWVRLRLRAALWRQWKTPCRRRTTLLELGVRERLASNTAGSGRGPWYLAKAKALAVGLSNAYFKSLGLPSLFEAVNITVSNRRVRTRRHGGVAGVGG
jgi:hypothetical protein